MNVGMWKNLEQFIGCEFAMRKKEIFSNGTVPFL